MEWTEEMIKQCSKPTGDLGLIVGKEMNKSHHALWKWGLSLVSITPDSTVLDIGCGGGAGIRMLSNKATKGKIYGIDHSDDMVKLAEDVNKDLIETDRVSIRQGSVSSLAFMDNMFDMVTAVETYYFWPDIINDLKEVLRVIKPGGKLVLVNETYKHEDFEQRNSRISKLLNMRYNSPEEFKEFLAEAGYISINITERPEINWITVIAQKSQK